MSSGICRGAFAVVGSLLTLLACGARDGLTMGFVDDAAVAHEPTPQPDAGVDAASDTDEPPSDATGDADDASLDAADDADDASLDAADDVDDASLDVGAPDIGVPDAGVPDAVADAGPTCVSSASPWVYGLGGSGTDTGNAVAIAPDGSLYVAGSFAQTVDFDPGPGVDMHTSNGGSDVFLSHFGCDGQHDWTVTFGGADSNSTTWSDYPMRLAVASDGSVLIAGQYCESVDFDPGPGVDLRPSQGCFDAFLAKFHQDGSYAWARAWGGPGRDRARSVGLAPDGSIYVSGGFEQSVDFDPGPGADWHVSAGSVDDFVLKLDSNGNFLWARTWGGPSSEYNAAPSGVAADGSVVVTSAFEGSVDLDPTSGVDLHQAFGQDDVCIVKLDAKGNFVWARTIASGIWASPFDLAVAPQGEMLIGGWFTGSLVFLPKPDAGASSAAGVAGFATRIEADGSYGWTKTFGSSSGTSVSVRAVGRIPDGSWRLGGSFSGTIDFDPESGNDSHTSSGMADAFVVTLAANGSYVGVRAASGKSFSDQSTVGGLAGWADGRAIATGSYQGTTDLGFGASSASLTANGGTDAFFAVFGP